MERGAAQVVNKNTMSSAVNVKVGLFSVKKKRVLGQH